MSVKLMDLTHQEGELIMKMFDAHLKTAPRYMEILIETEGAARDHNQDDTADLMVNYINNARIETNIIQKMSDSIHGQLGIPVEESE